MRIVCLSALCALLLSSLGFSPVRAEAGYPMISGLRNLILKPDRPAETVRFHVRDTKTGAASLSVEASSDNPALVPNDGNHILLGGAGADRTIKVIPVPGVTGTAIITVRVTDTDGVTSQDTFQVDVVKAPVI